MERLDVDVAIIGAGTAGMRAYREASKVTDSIVVVEGGHYGITCARVGCMPSKLLIAAADAAHNGRRADLFGVHFGPPEINGREVMRRIRNERDRFVSFVIEAIESWPEEHRVKATARFKSDHELELDDGRTVVANRIVIATGSRTNILPIFEEFGDRMLTNDDVFDWEDLPRSVVVFGAGVIRLELGQALHRLGVRTAIFGRDNLVGFLSDPEVMAAAREIFSREFEFHPDGDVTRRTRTAEGVEIDHVVDSHTNTARFDYALVATGRRADIDTLGLEHTSLQCDAKGVPVFDPYSGRCGESHIFMAGDANNLFPLLHEAADEGFVAGFNAARFPDVRRFSKSAPISIMFTDPQIIAVGETFNELQKRGVDFGVGSVDWSDQGRARVIGENRGLLRVYGERNSGRFVGAEMIGPRAEHIAHLLAWSVQSGLTVAEMLERPFYHPVLEEGVRTALRNLNHDIGMGPPPPPRCIDCGPGG